MKYRKEIDGIRAIAVLGVIFYHAGFAFASAGYAGVDVFFVISGYLIGGQILNDLKAGTFSFREFYKRRARRILPALYLVIVVATIIGAFLLVPHDYRYFGGAALSTLLFTSNVWFMERIDYFNPEAAQDPLVHTWSLGIEEQFYLLAPVLLFLVWTLIRTSTAGVLWLTFLVSFAASLALSKSQPEASFYLLHTRAWELLAGVLVAWYMRPERSAIVRSHGPMATLGGWLGIFLLFAGISFVPDAAPWPGSWAALPVSGTVLLLLFADKVPTVIGVLSVPPIRFVGLISYSAYLWHQPAFSFLEQAGALPQSMLALSVLIAAILGVSAVSWRYVETPFRRQYVSRKLGRSTLLVAAICIVVFAVGGHFSKGYPQRLSPEASSVLAYADSYGPNYERCVRSRVHVPDMKLEDACVYGSADSPTVALWGDSHAARLADPLAAALNENGVSMTEFTVTSCVPVPGLVIYGQTRAERCPEFNQRVLEYLQRHSGISTVVMFGTWDNYFSREGAPNALGVASEDGSFFSYPVGTVASIPEDQRQAAVLDSLKNVLLTLTESGKQVVLVASLPRPDIRVPEVFAKRVWYGEELPINSGYPRAYFDRQTSLSRRLFAEVAAANESVKVIYPEVFFCNEEECLMLKAGHPLFTDGNHPTLEGSALILPSIVSTILECRSCAEK